MALNVASLPEAEPASPKIDGELPPLAEIVERIGFGFAHFRATIIGGGVWLADGAELLLIGTVTQSVSREWGLRAWERGLVVSVVFVGIFIGNFVCGPLGDTWGRRMPVILSYAGVCLFSILSSMTQNIESLVVIRLFAGAFFRNRAAGIQHIEYRDHAGVLANLHVWMRSAHVHLGRSLQHHAYILR